MKITNNNALHWIFTPLRFIAAGELQRSVDIKTGGENAEIIKLSSAACNYSECKT